MKKPSISEEFWSTSTYEMENSRAHSQRSISSISTLPQNFDHHGGTGSTSNPPEIVNHGKCKVDLTIFECPCDRIAIISS